MPNSLWPDFSTMPAPPRGIREMLVDAAGDIDARTNGAIQFYVDTLGVSAAVEKVRHNCYLRVTKTGYTHLLFRVTTPVPGPWPATASTPHGKRTSNGWKTKELCQVVNVPAGPLAFDFERRFAGIPP
jgi:hypothetical protein